MLEAFVPGRSGLVNQRREPFFEKYGLTGKTYTTANGAVIPNELVYHDGEMAHFHGECTNVSAVCEVLAGSGYRPLTLKYPDGRETAVVQIWSSKFTITSIGPYNAMFIVVMAVRYDAPPERASIRADPNGASSVLPMLDGSFNPATSVYENRARLFLVRLLDSTQVAIDVGRERMGTDKRPGTIDMTHSGRRLRVSIKDQHGRGMVKAELELDDSDAYLPDVAKAAATAGIAFRPFPDGTEYSYPTVARIGRGPIVSWQWRSDIVPRLQRVPPGKVVLDASSEEGRILVSWGFTPKVLGYIPSVRGVITGLVDPVPQHTWTRDTQGTTYGGTTSSLFARSAASGTPVIRPLERLQAAALQEQVPLLRAILPGEAAGLVGQLPVLRLMTQPASPRSDAGIRTSASEEISGSNVAAQPHWAWDTTFLGSLTASLRKELVGETPDGLRINWHVRTGSFVGPGLDAIVLPGAADWMRIRRDGVAIVNVHACFETRDGARVYGSYGGIFDLGPNGYARALRDEYDQLPPVVVTPTYATADPRLQWLNRAQCVGVGRVDMSALRVEFDVYVVRVGNRCDSISDGGYTIGHATSPRSSSLYARLGGHDAMVAITEDFVAAVLADRQLARFFPNAHAQPGMKELNDRVVELLCDISGGPCVYRGRDMKTAHKGMGITDSDWKIAVDLFTAAVDKQNVALQDRVEFVKIIEDMKDDIVEVRETH